MEFCNFKRRIQFVIIVLIICNIIPTCAGSKAEISRSFAMTADSAALPQITGFSPQFASNAERFFVSVRGAGFDKDSRLLIKGYRVGKKYLKVIADDALLVRVPKGVPAGRYPVAIKNPDGKTSNEVVFEVKG